MNQNMTITELLEQLRGLFGNERDKGTAFEKLIKMYLENEPKYMAILSDIWMWKDFPYRENIGDTGIDLVAKTYDGDFWAIQCKFYAEEYEITKGDVDTFLATSSKYFYVDGQQTKFMYRLIASTTDHYNHIAESTLENQNPPVGRIGLGDLLESQIDWEKYSLVSQKVPMLQKKKPRDYQKEAIKDVIEGFKTHDRGKLIMACGTGKTYTSLKIAEKQLNGKGNILFLVPSIALASQTLSEWTSQCEYTFNACVVCSDNKASKGDNSTDLGIPSTTNVDRLLEWYNGSQKLNRNMNFIFSTYQSIDVVSNFQKETGLEFDLIICDEAHRTTGVTLSDEDESSFVKVHDNNFIKGKKRLYMTATPKIYGDGAKGRANEVNAELCSMDDESIYGPEFHKLSFSEAVKQGLLTDYKVLVLAVDEEYVKIELQDLLKDENHELKLDDSVKIMGCWNGLSKISTWDEKQDFLSDPTPMKRAVAFCNRIIDSKKLVEMFDLIQKHVQSEYNPNNDKLVKVDIKHVDGSFNALEKKERINWLKDDIKDGECRILTNARCLSEGVDVPALDAVMFLNPRSSMIDIIQSVGRVMRKSEGKKYGYVILPIGVSASEDPDEALNNNEKYKLVWEVLQALRAHDDRFNNTINKIDLNKKKPDQIEVIGIGLSKSEDKDNGTKIVKMPDDIKKKIQLTLDLKTFDEWKDSIYAKMVKRVGSRIYWEMWAKDVADIATSHMKKIKELLNTNDPNIKKAITEFIDGLRQNLNNSITEDDAIEMLSEHMITKPVFNALFDKYEFVNNNPVSQTMQKMIDILDKQFTEEERKKLNEFYESIKERAQGIDNAAGKQKIILELYEKFFKTALPKEVEKLGIVYTPTECVDFIINSVEYLMKKEFGKSLSDHGVHIIDGFTGTGTFIVRLLQSGIIKPQDLLYKYTNDIHANEIVLLAYYIAAINIEETFHELNKSEEYIPFDGIVLTDTFQLYEDSNEHEWTKNINELALPQNSERALKQRELPITVCIGNPPYSIGQKSANDNAQNLSYPKLDFRIMNTYAANSKANLKKGLYDLYIKAFRWASDRIQDNGIIAFITNGSYIDNQGMDGFRKCLLGEFTSIYVFNLRGNQRTSGETSRKEGGKIFGSGSRTPVAITFLIKNRSKINDRFIHYYDIGDYLSREQKLNIINKFNSINNIEWKHITPDENNDWINKRNHQFKSFIPIWPKNKYEENKSFFNTYSLGIATNKDSFLYNFSSVKLTESVRHMIEYYNFHVKADGTPEVNPQKIIWTDIFKNMLSKKINMADFNQNYISIGMYRPFCKQKIYYKKELIQRTYQQENIYLEKSNQQLENITICLSGISSNKGFSCVVTKYLPDLQFISNGQCFPLFWYEKNNSENLFNKNKVIRHDAITNYIQNTLIDKYKKNIEKVEIFYYVYGLLHSKDYRTAFVSDLKKSLPRIPIVDTYEKFLAFSEAGKKLANLHLNYEQVKPYSKCKIFMYPEVDYNVTKMKFGKSKNNSKDKTIIEYNDKITISNIPEKAYEYVVNGKSAIEWIMERYAVTVDKKSGIVNDPNDWCKEVNDEKYIFNLLLRIINVSIHTVDIVNSLPRLDFED